MNGFDISTISGIYVGSTPYSAIYKGSNLVWSAGPHDYSKDYLTIESLEDNNEFKLLIYSPYGSSYESIYNSSTKELYYSRDKLNWYQIVANTSTLSNADVITTLNTGDKIYLKGFNLSLSDLESGRRCGTNIRLSKNFKVYGNIMSLLYESSLSSLSSFIGKTSLNDRNIYTFCGLFYKNSKLVDISNLVLPATTLKGSCYSDMFYSCTSLTTVPKDLLPATSLISSCYSQMFRSCTSLTTAPELPATTLATYCYDYMFQGCTSLTTAPELPATNMIQSCYRSMFDSCRALTTAPELPSTSLASGCYETMFQSCTSLTTAPELPATTLVTNCYKKMFYGCTSLNYIKALFTTTPSISYTDNWVYNVAASGTFIKNTSATWNVTGVYGVPSGWDVYSNEKEEPFTIVSLSNNNTISIENTLGSSFTLYYNGNYLSISSSGTTTITTLNKKDIVRIIADTSFITRSSSNYLNIKATGDFIVRGNIMSLLNAWSFTTLTSVANYQFYNLFKDNTYLKDASGLILPATTLATQCYRYMFYGCTSLVTPPRKLPAATFPSYNTYQYSSMFHGCTSLTTVPKLLNTTLSTGCYANMFYGCTSLVKVPYDLLPTTTLVAQCYSQMFYGCTSLTTAPDLPATTLANNCYYSMFDGCTSLNYIKAMFTTDISSTTNYTDSWLHNVASSGTFIKNSAATWTKAGASGIPTGWTVQTA